MLTGQQIRQARSSLGWGQWRLARQVHLKVRDIAYVESCHDVPNISAIRLAKIRNALEEAGIRFDPFNRVVRSTAGSER